MKSNFRGLIKVATSVYLVILGHDIESYLIFFNTFFFKQKWKIFLPREVVRFLSLKVYT